MKLNLVLMLKLESKNVQRELIFTVYSTGNFHICIQSCLCSQYLNDAKQEFAMREGYFLGAELLLLHNCSIHGKPCYEMENLESR